MRLRLLTGLPAALLLAFAWLANADADQTDPRLPGLFNALKATSDPDEGAQIGRRIAAIWNEHPDDDVEQILHEGRNFMARGNLKLALKAFTVLTKIAPNFAEAWNKRASVLYKIGELEAAARDVKETLSREPRHFLAIAGLGVIYLRKGRLEEALRAFEHALAINPHLPGTQSAADELRVRLGI